MENLFTQIEQASGAFGTELAKLQGASPVYKVFMLEKTLCVDTLPQWNAGTLNGITAGTSGTFGTNGNICILGNITPGTYGTTLYKLHPNMTGSLLPTGYICSQSSVYVSGNFYGWGVFDGTNGYNGGPAPSGFWAAVTVANEWVQLQMPTPKNIRMYTLKSRADIYCEQMPASWHLLGGTDGTNWGTLDTKTNEIWTTANQIQTYNIPSNTGTYNYYRLFVKKPYGTPSAEVISLNELQFWGYGTESAPVGEQGTCGTYTSQIFDSKLYSNYKQLNWSAILNSGTLLAQFRTGSTTPDCDAKTWNTILSGTRPNICDNQFYQFRLILSGNGTTTPVVDCFSGTYLYNPSNDPNAGLFSVGNLSRQTERLMNQFEVSGASPQFKNSNGWWNTLGKILDFGTIRNIQSIIKNTQAGTPAKYTLTFPSATTVFVNGTSAGTIGTSGTFSNIVTGLDIVTGTQIQAGGTTDITTGLYWANYGMYNDKIEIWKGFEYNGTREFIPAFTGYIDNIFCDALSGKAIVNSRDKGKLFKIRTSEKCTQTGTAGGAYWTGLRIDQCAEKLIVQACQYGTNLTNYEIDKSVVVDSLGVYHWVQQEYQNIGTNVYGHAITFLNGTFFMVDYDSVLSYTPQGTTKREFGLTTEGKNLLNDGTRVYAVDGNGVWSWNSGTVIQISANTSFRRNAVYYNNYIYTGTQLNAGTILLHKYNVLTGTFGTCNNSVLLNISNFGLDSIHGKLFIMYDNKAGMVSNFYYDITTEIGTKTSTETALTITIDEQYGLSNQIKYNQYQNRFAYTAWIRTSPGGTNWGNVLVQYNADVGASGVSLVGFSGTGEYYSAIEIGGTNKWYFTTSQYGTYNIPSRLFDTDPSGVVGTIGTINPVMHKALGMQFAPTYYNYGTFQPRLIIKGVYANLPFTTGTTFISQYSTEYNNTIGTLDVGVSDSVANVLQQLAQANNSIQYIDEGGKYFFKRRDPGIEIKYNFTESDLTGITMREGDSLQESPIYNHVVWGTNTGTVVYDDLNSQGTYGLQAYQLSNKWITQAGLANDICFGISSSFRMPRKIIDLNLRWYPGVKIMDIITIDSPKVGIPKNKKWQVIGIQDEDNPFSSIITAVETLV